MSLLLRCIRQQRQLLFNGTVKSLAPSSTQVRFPSSSASSSSSSTPPKPEKDEEAKEYTVKFKPGIDVKKVFKDLYSLYGPLFIGCHIGVSLISLGFFTSLVWFSVDLNKIMPEVLIDLAGQTMMSMTGSGGKFVLAYAIHKVILPFRLTSAIILTRFLSQRIKRWKK